MYAQTTVGLLCYVGSGSNVTAALDSSATGIDECKAVKTINTYTSMCMCVRARARARARARVCVCVCVCVNVRNVF